MECHLHSCPLRDRNDYFQKIFQVAPELLLAYLTPFRHTLLFCSLVTELADQSPAPRGYVYSCTIPTKTCHPVVANYCDTRFAKSFNSSNVIFNFFVTAGKAQLNPLCGHRVALHACEYHIKSFEIFLNFLQRFKIPPARNLT